MKQQVTQAIILTRTDYGEADRILTLLTPDHGKLRLLAKGVRRVKSKLAGGIELFSVSTITFVQGRGDLGTLISTRLIKHYATIVTDLDRTMLGYNCLKQLNKITEDDTEAAYFDLLNNCFAALDEAGLAMPLIGFWFAARLLAVTGHMPNLHTDDKGRALQQGKRYGFSFEKMCFVLSERGNFTAPHIKFLRLAVAARTARMLQRIEGSGELTQAMLPLVQGMRQHWH